MKLSFDEVLRRKEILDANKRNGLQPLEELVERIRGKHCPSDEEIASFAEARSSVMGTFRLVWHILAERCNRCHQTVRSVLWTLVVQSGGFARLSPRFIWATATLLFVGFVVWQLTHLPSKYFSADGVLQIGHVGNAGGTTANLDTSPWTNRGDIIITGFGAGSSTETGVSIGNTLATSGTTTTHLQAASSSSTNSQIREPGLSTAGNSSSHERGLNALSGKGWDRTNATPARDLAGTEGPAGLKASRDVANNHRTDGNDDVLNNRYTSRGSTWALGASFGRALEDSGVEIILDWNSPAGRTAPTVPRLGNIAGFAAVLGALDRNALTLTKADMEDWLTDFVPEIPPREMANDNLGGHSGLAAISSSVGNGTAISLKSMLRLWLHSAVPRESKIFISYTLADHASAEAIATALIKRGHLVHNFMSARGQTETGAEERVAAGWLFKEAGTRFVLDSQDSRKSKNLAFAARFDEVIRRYASVEDGELPKVPRETVELLDSEFDVFRPSGGVGGIVLGVTARPSDEVKPAAMISWDGHGRAGIKTRVDGKRYLMPVLSLAEVAACGRFVRSKDCFDSAITISAGRDTNVCEELRVPSMVALLSDADSVALDTVSPRMRGRLLSRIIDQSIEFRYEDSGSIAFATKLVIRVFGDDHIGPIFEGMITARNGKRTLTWDKAKYVRHVAHVAEDEICARVARLCDVASVIGFFRWLDSTEPSVLTHFLEEVKDLAPTAPDVGAKSG